MSLLDVKQELYDKHHAALVQEYGVNSITVCVSDKSVNGAAWFDECIGGEFRIYGLSLDTIPKMYVRRNGDSIPFSCAKVIQS